MILRVVPLVRNNLKFYPPWKLTFSHLRRDGSKTSFHFWKAYFQMQTCSFLAGYLWKFHIRFNWTKTTTLSGIGNSSLMGEWAYYNGLLTSPFIDVGCCCCCCCCCSYCYCCFFLSPLSMHKECCFFFQIPAGLSSKNTSISFHQHKKRCCLEGNTKPAKLKQLQRLEL